MIESADPSDEPIEAFELNWEFERTGLAKGAFASLLGFDRALVTRLLQGRRSWKPGEAVTARAFFALVPKGIDQRFRDAVRQLTRNDRLARVAKAITADPEARRMLGERPQGGGAMLRADQVVHLCRIGKIDLPELVARGRVVLEKQEARLALFDPTADETYARAAAGEFLGWKGARSPDVPVAAFLRSSTVDHETAQPDARGGRTLQPGSEIDRTNLNTCTALVVADGSLEPRYRRGETILVEPPEHGFRHGDDVVIELEGEGAFEVGRLLIEGREKLVIEHPRRGNISIERVAIRSTRRIAFVAR
ncbi:hypothetical protein V1281_000375 [Nitrobacteraceae bacterium AZCC 2161]